MLKSEAIDYKVDCIKSDVKVNTLDKGYELEIEINTVNGNINRLLDEKKIKRGLYVRSGAVWFRKFFDLQNDNKLFIPSHEIYGKVELLPCNVAVDKIDVFYSNDFSNEFKDLKITINPGELVGIGEELCFDALLESDVLKNTSSIFVFNESDEKSISYDIENSVAAGRRSAACAATWRSLTSWPRGSPR
jgi:hypothetical protein